MTPMLFTEYENERAQCCYPFTDTATMTSIAGTRLPSDAFVDAFLYPIDLVGGVYLSKLELHTRTVEFSDSANERVCGTAQWIEGELPGHALIYDTTPYARCIGTIVFGPGLATFAGESPLIFNPTALPLVPTCFVALNQHGVRGMVGDDGQLVTGHVKLEGRGGVYIKTYIGADSKPIVRIDIRGVAPTPTDDCYDCPAIEQLIIENGECTPIVGTPGANGVLLITGFEFDMTDLCRGKAIPAVDGVISRDYCVDPPGEPTKWECPAESVYVIPIVDGRLELAAPSTLDADNPVHIETRESVGDTLNLATLDDITNPSEFERRLQQLLRAGIKPGGQIVIGLKGRMR